MSASLHRTAFTGHRPEKISGWAQEPDAVERNIKEALAAEITAACKNGSQEFLCGMAPGFDLWAAETVLELRERGIITQCTRLTAVVPYEGFERSFDSASRKIYSVVLRRADKVVMLATKYGYGCYRRRNDFLVDNADAVIAYSENVEGGTRYTVDRAVGRGLPVTNLFQRVLF